LTVKVKIVGAGLIGTSLALSLASNGHEIALSDSDIEHEQIARDLVGSSLSTSAAANPDLVVIATPVQHIFESLLSEYSLNPEAKFIDVGGLKTNLLLEVARIPGLNSRFLGTHPMAGRESGGPTSARGDLFEGRAWIVTPSSQTSPSLLALVNDLIKSTGASAFELEPELHDEQIALISHLPQLAATLLAGALVDRDPGELTLAGAGLRDTTRLAASSPDLWSHLLALNAHEVRPLLQSLKESIDKLIDHLNEGDLEGIRAVMQLGNEGRALIPGKHGGRGREYHLLPIVIEDKPGQLAKIFQECEEAEVNVEDLQIEHSPGQETGLITLSLSEKDALKLHDHLLKAGWLAHTPRTA
jgi:prephenate dehydrogenase